MPDYRVLFDFASVSLNTTYHLIIVLFLGVWLTFGLARSDAPNGQKAAMAFITLAMLGAAAFTTLRAKSRHSAISDAIGAGDIAEVEGVIERRRRYGEPRYAIGARDLDVSWRYPALNADDGWMRENLVGRCARLRITSNGDIIWVGVRRDGCTPTYAEPPPS